MLLPTANEVCEGYVFTRLCHCGWTFAKFMFTGRNEVVAKVIFLHLFVILFTGGGGLPQCVMGCHPPHPPRSKHPPGPDPPCPPEQTPPQGSRLQYTVNERPVRILLECILVLHVSVILSTGLGDTWTGTPLGPGTPPGAVHAGRYGQQAGGTHITGMHSCLFFIFIN